jgi:hypothetical protein
LRVNCFSNILPSYAKSLLNRVFKVCVQRAFQTFKEADLASQVGGLHASRGVANA